MPLKALATTWTALSQSVRFGAERQRVCMLRVAHILDVDSYAITAGETGDILWGGLEWYDRCACKSGRGAGVQKIPPAIGDCDQTMAIPVRPTVAHLPRSAARWVALPSPAISAMLRARNSGRE